MAEYKPQAVKDVPAGDFIAAYAAHLKSTDKVVFLACSSDGGRLARTRQQQWPL
jgi:ribosomal protein S19E (S16A)